MDSKKLMKMAKKWQRRAALGRKRLISVTTSSDLATKGHFVVYTSDKRRFVFPIEYLSNDLFKDLFRMSEEEFGLPKNGPITLPCDSLFLEYAVHLISHCATEATQKALLMSIAVNPTTCSSSYFGHGENNFQFLVSTF